MNLAIPEFISMKAPHVPPASTRRNLSFEVLSVLADSDCTIHKLHEELDTHQSSIDYALRRLVRAGLVERAGYTKRTRTRPAVIWRLALRLRGTP